MASREIVTQPLADSKGGVCLSCLSVCLSLCGLRPAVENSRLSGGSAGGGGGEETRGGREAECSPPASVCLS